MLTKIKNQKIKCQNDYLEFRTIRVILRNFQIPFDVSLLIVCWTYVAESTQSLPWISHGIDLLLFQNMLCQEIQLGQL